MRACIDIGGTKVSVSLHDPAAGLALQWRRSEPSARDGREAVARQVIRMVDTACAEAGLDPASVQSAGVAAPGPFIRVDGCIELATPNLGGPSNAALLEAPLRQRFRDLRIDNDGIAALQAERRWGALQGVEHCAYVTWSTGVGCGLCVGGVPLRGKQGNAGHLGHVFVSDDDQARCGCGNLGDVEALVGGRSIERRFGEPAAILLGRAASGDVPALHTVDELCRVMGRALYGITALMDLERISLGGSVFLHHQDLLLPRLQREVHAHLPVMTKGCELVPAGLGERVGDLAALALLD